ncbi:MAG: Type IV leader peptidase family protein [Pelotomaculum sp. PtaU1.Bin035]|nr:MAG: Type IV leader peptidase family protein [Pelotomaculum sp. PtaU1.Bin035]
MGIDFSHAGNLPLLLKGGIFIVLLLAASLFDIRKRIIPDPVCLAIALTGCILFEPVKLLGILTALPLLMASLLWGGMGGGDIKLMAAAGIVLGFKGGMAAMVMGLAALLLFYAGYRIAQKLRRGDCPGAFPLAPFLSIGCLAAYFIL